MFYYLLAWFILTGPLEYDAIREYIPYKYLNYEKFMVSIKTAAMNLDLMSEKEVLGQYDGIEIVDNNFGIDADIKQLRQGYKDNLPPSWTANQFPHIIRVKGNEEHLIINQMFLKYCENQIINGPLHQENNWKEIREETLKLRKIYFNLLTIDPKIEYIPLLQKRYALQEIYERIGHDNFWSGRIPPPVPIWRFSQF